MINQQLNKSNHLNALNYKDFFRNAIIPSKEIGSYEALWLQDKSIWFNKISDMFSKNDGMLPLPSDIINNDELAHKYYTKVIEYITKANIKKFGVKFRGTGDYPMSLEDAKDKLELIYYAGDWDLIFTPSIAVVGTRKPTEEGIKRTKKLVKGIIEQGYTVVSGLAEGIDTVAHETAIDSGGRTLAVIGTALDQVYPQKNTALFSQIVEKFLVISQVPFIKYHLQNPSSNRFFFPERNKTMSAITKATIIVEASETSGTLVQARAALNQGRKLFILASCFNKGLTWPDKYLTKGAIKVDSFDDIWNNL